MFTKASVLKAFTAINNHKDNKGFILDSCKTQEGDNKAFLKTFNERLVTDELVQYINTNCDELHTIKFGKTEELGAFGKSLARLGREIGEGEKVLYHEGMAFCVGDCGSSGGIGRYITPQTYIFDDGSFVVVDELLYGDDIDSPYMTLISPNNEEAPVLNNVDKFFPEDCRNLWDV